VVFSLTPSNKVHQCRHGVQHFESLFCLIRNEANFSFQKLKPEKLWCPASISVWVISLSLSLSQAYIIVASSYMYNINKRRHIIEIESCVALFKKIIIYHYKNKNYPFKLLRLNPHNDVLRLCFIGRLHWNWKLLINYWFQITKIIFTWGFTCSQLLLNY